LFLLALKFLFWYFSKRNSPIIFFYGLAFMILSVSIFFVYIGENALIIQKPSWITPMMKVVYPDIESNIFDQFYEYYKYLLGISLILLLVDPTCYCLNIQKNSTYKTISWSNKFLYVIFVDIIRFFQYN
jgi:hypothetical protein